MGDPRVSWVGVADPGYPMPVSPSPTDLYQLSLPPGYVIQESSPGFLAPPNPTFIPYSPISTTFPNIPIGSSPQVYPLTGLAPVENPQVHHRFPSRKSDGDLSIQARKTVRSPDPAPPRPVLPNPGNRILNVPRSCTDIICLGLFIVFLAAWGVLAFFAIRWGDPQKLIHPSDSGGRLCGTYWEDHYNLTDKPYLLYFDLTQCISYATAFEGCPTQQICVSKCPDYYFTYIQLRGSVTNAMFEAMKNDKLICKDEKIKKSLKTFKEVERAVSDDLCALYVVATEPVAGRCLPKQIVEVGNKLTEGAEKEKINNLTVIADGDERVPNSTTMGATESFVHLMLDAKKFGEAVLADLQWSSWQIGVFLVTGAIIAFIWIILMRWIAGIMIWISIAAVVAAFGVGTGFCWYQYAIVKEEGGLSWRWTLNGAAYLRMPKFWLVLGIIASVILGLTLLILLFLRKRIQVAIALIKESSKAVTHIMSALFFPIVPFLLQLLVFGFWGLVGVHLASWGVPNCRRLGVPSVNSSLYSDASDKLLAGSRNETGSLLINSTQCDCETDLGSSDDPYCKFVNYTQDSNFVFAAQAFNLFGLFWGLFFVEALAQLTLAGAFASYYWAFRKPDDMPSLPVLRGFWRAIRYHLGSIAFGSLIIAITRWIRAILEYLENKMKYSENPIAKGFFKCLRCFFWCLEQFLRFLSKNAYIMIAIHGGNFFTSAKDAFSLLMRNAVRVWVLDKVTDFLFFLGKLLITAGMGVLAFFYFSGHWTWNVVLVGTLNHYWVPVAIISVGTYMICCAFFGVYEMAVDTTFLCFLEDSERNDGTPERPYYMSKALMKILNKKNKFHKEKNKDKE